MKNGKIKSARALIHMLIILVVTLGLLVCIAFLNIELVKKIYLVDEKTIFLNGFIFLIFLSGVIYLTRAYAHLKSEEKQVSIFIQETENGEFALEDLSPESLIARRYDIIQDLYKRQVPINHAVISSIMIAEESLYQSYPKFVNNVLILTGVFGTIVSLIFALVGASTILESVIPGEGMGIMLLGMNTALTTTASAIVCFFLFTYFYQRFTDIQTYVFSRIEEASLVYIVPEFAFDSEAVNYKTEQLVKQLRSLVEELGKSADFIKNSLQGLNEHNQAHLEKIDTLIARQEDQLEKSENVLSRLDSIKDVLINGFRLS